MTPIVLVRGRLSEAESLAAYRERGGYEALRSAVTTSSPEEVLQPIAEAGLRGKGGAAFPTARKWELARAAAGGPKVVVANGGEHEPGSYKDRLIAGAYPHAVLEGLALAAFATGASEGWLYLLEEMGDAGRAEQAAGRAIDEARAAGLLGESLFGSRFTIDVAIARAPASYVAGEETAALEAIEGRPAKPRKKPPYPGEAGLGGRPTTVNNLETLAHVPPIVRNGASWYRALGRAGAPGTMLVTLDDHMIHAGVHEVAMGMPLRELLFEVGGGTRSGKAIRAIQPALSTPLLSAAHLDRPLTHEAIEDAGSTLGCGGFSVIEEDACLLARLLEIARFFAREQCGQCPPCRMETNTLEAVLGQVLAGTEADYAAQIAKITAFARGKGLCSLIAMAAAPVLSALRLFPEEFEAHARQGRCAYA